MIDRKTKGSNAERELIKKFWDSNSWAALRVAGSGVSRFPCPDIIAGNGSRFVAIECKSVSGDYIRVERKQLEDLKIFAGLFGAEVWIGARFVKDLTNNSHGEGWFFFSVEDLVESPGGFSISLVRASYKGLSFDELLALTN
ncbi:Holliday junction resolvase [Candidatus Woesearchaeota archaeon]|nr:Holliday junction resolvase [Candidatus Woesearchaeota archaeon]